MQMCLTYPNLAASIDGKSITSPNKLSVDVRDHNVLDDNIAPACDAETFAFAEGKIQPQGQID